MARSLYIFAAFAFAACWSLMPARAGDKEVRVPERREFHMSMDYPYIFQPQNYLLAAAPVAMRYGDPIIDDSHRRAPALPAAAKGTPPPKKDEKTAAATPSPTPKDTSIEVQTASEPAAYPVPDNGQPGVDGKGGADFGKAPDEVVGYFRNPYNFVPNSHRFFDPIFEPAVGSGAPAPQSAQMGPHSTATYIQKP